METPSTSRQPRTPAILIVIAVVVQVLLATPQASADRHEGFVTVLFGRTQWVSVGTIGGRPCRRLPHTVTLGRAREDLARMGINATGVVIVSDTPERGLRCDGYRATHPGWHRLRAWSRDGWRFVSGGDHRDIRRATEQQQRAQTCGSLRMFRDHGLNASGMYAYANDTWSVDLQVDTVSTCFDFGRRYQPWGVNRRSSTGPPWFQMTHSVNGGRCNLPGRPCYVRTGAATTHYDSPRRLAALANAAPDTWFAMQFYRFVRGVSHRSSQWTWDCRGHDWRRHFTSQWELYCYSDFLKVMRRLDAHIRDGGVTAASPSRVARAWGRDA